MIDIGGPTMVRAAAKNHAFVGVVVDPADYRGVADELTESGWLSADTRSRLARAAFAHTAAYDAAIVDWMDRDSLDLPPTIHLALEQVAPLRYGENPHQRGARYREIGGTSWWDDVTQLSGLPMSYLNLYDTAAAWSLVRDLANVTDDRIAAIIKHANPCGVGSAPDLAGAYRKAYECDPRSAFGGIVAIAGVVDLATLTEIEQAAQADVIIATGFSEGVVERLIAKRKNTRLLVAPQPTARDWHIRQISGGWLVQDPHHFGADAGEWKVVTERQPTDQERADAEFAWRVCAHVSSNSIVLAKDGAAWGIGAGQQNRVEAGKLAADKAAGRAQGGASASDAFYPFPDGVEAAAAAGVAVVIQPGGAMRDDAVIARANELGLAMIFTGERQFLH
jgi:phosphoribosylaminoimidazolecarboxamide formyltransferase/IMP cyclohydrolase